TLYLCQKKIKVLQIQYLSKFAALSTHTFCPITPKRPNHLDFLHGAFRKLHKISKIGKHFC
ncbi:hypothetical protein, partial [Veillonella sp.]|uniref:hypothetical protein n=1 Tax=Veillonella sp. TaxID=1926307 RepID=UPI0025D8770F